MTYLLEDPAPRLFLGIGAHVWGNRIIQHARKNPEYFWESLKSGLLVFLGCHPGDKTKFRKRTGRAFFFCSASSKIS